MKLVKLVANLGYGSRKEVTQLCRAGRITSDSGYPLQPDDDVEPAIVRVDGEVLDPVPGLVLMMNKPVGYTCSHRDPAGVVYDLLPARYRRRRPAVSTVGRLDRDTSGLLLLTDDGVLLHRIVSPKANIGKIYEVTLARDVRADAAAIFASGALLLEAETTPLQPAVLQLLAPRLARITVTEGRYHQVRRMFAAVENHVLALTRVAVGGLTLGELASGQWRMLTSAELQTLFCD